MNITQLKIQIEMQLEKLRLDFKELDEAMGLINND